MVHKWHGCVCLHEHWLIYKNKGHIRHNVQLHTESNIMAEDVIEHVT